MKKKILLFVFVFLFPFFVDAKESQEHIYNIESFNISGNTISISGYSFISHRDNYGKMGGYGNLETYVVAYTGSWNNAYVTNSSSSGSDYYRVKANVQARDYWGSRCTSTACDYESTVIEQFKNGVIDNDSACHIEGAGNSRTRNYLSVGGSSCLYYNVGFSVSLSIDKIFSSLSNEKEQITDLKFKLVSVIDSQSPKKIAASDMGIYKKVCFYNGKQCPENGVIETTDYTFSINDMSNKVYFDATRTNGRVKSGNSFVGGAVTTIFAAKNECGYGSSPCYYEILDYAVGQVVYKGKFIINNNLMFNLKSYYDTTKNPSYESNLFPDNPYGNRQLSQDYWIASDRVQISGSFSIKNLKKNIVKVTCKDKFSTNSKTDNTVKCDSTGVKNQGNYNQCIENKVTVTKKLYYPSADSTYCTANSYNKKTINGKTYVLIDVSTNVLLNQEATFTFGNMYSNDGQITNSVIAGKGFMFKDTTYSNTVTWVNANRYSNGRPHYSYGNDYTFENNCAGTPITVSSSYDPNVYYINSEGNLVSAKLSVASFELINEAVQKNLIKTSNVNNINFISCDSNDSSDCNVNNPNKLVDGSWRNSENVTTDYRENGYLFGKKITNKYSYELTDSYVLVAGDEAGKAKYIADSSKVTEELKATGKKFYVDFKWVYNADLPFNLSNSEKNKTINPSLVKGMEWNLKGTCSIDVKDGYYTNNQGDDTDIVPILRIKYRSIDVNNPFPKGNVASNWEEWYSQTSNKNRLSMTYQKLDDPLYKITLGKLNSNDTVQISEINGITRHYLSLDNLEVNGTSDFVVSYFSKRAIAGVSYCPLGIFNTDCDKWWGD